MSAVLAPKSRRLPIQSSCRVPRQGLKAAWQFDGDSRRGRRGDTERFQPHRSIIRRRRKGRTPSIRIKILVTRPARRLHATVPSCAAKRIAPTSVIPSRNPRPAQTLAGFRAYLIQHRFYLASKEYQRYKEPPFKENVFFDLKNPQTVVGAFDDGISALPTTYCYLRPDFPPVQMTCFGQERVAFAPERISASASRPLFRS